MWERFKYKLMQTKQLAGIEAVQLVDGSFVYNLVILERKKDTADFLFKQADINNIKELQKQLTLDIPIVLVLNIKGIIHRKTAQVFSSNQEALSSVLPTANAEDFYIQQHNLAEGNILSIVRKSVIAETIAQFKSLDLTVLDIYLGSFLVENIYASIVYKDAIISTYTHNLSFEKDHLADYQISTTPSIENSLIGDQQISNKLLVALAAAYQAFAQPFGQNMAIPQLTTLQEDFLYKRLFRTLGIAILGFFFIGLLINFLLFSSYQEQNNKLNFELGHKELALARRDTLKAQYREKMAVLGDQLQLEGSKVSFYADQLAASLPSTIQLTTLHIFPALKEDNYAEEGQVPQYQNSTIHLKGQCKGSVFYNNWKHSLEELHWIKSLHNISYKNINEDVGLFELEIEIVLPNKQ